MRNSLFINALLCFSIGCQAQQPSTTAFDHVPPYNGRFGYGVNPGIYPPHYMDKELADLGRSFGVTTLRPALPESFLDYWGYDIRTAEYQHYLDIGLRDQVVFVGFPSEAHRDSAYYCPGVRSELFENLYTPIWDNGENDTPVNDNNPYALYIWKAVRTYGHAVKFWEVWNEPDLSNGNAWAPPGYAGNWWENVPSPCETKLQAPLYFYVRMLRITYEIVKSEDPDAYVCLGGIGYPSFLDLVCRLTDNPFDGTVTNKYPLKGGAYFDVVSFHSYPHIDNSLRAWDNGINGFRYFRHSDAAIDGIWRLKSEFETVLEKYGFGVQYPEKEWIITEVNIPRKVYGDYIGSDEAQINFTIKTLVTAQQQDVAQVHFYCLADEAPPHSASSEFAYMGLFKNLQNVALGNYEANNMAYAFKTTAQLLGGAAYDPGETQRLNLPSNIRGGAFRDTLGQYVYVLWAVTDKDNNEFAHAAYQFPAALNLEYLEQKNWHYSQSGVGLIVNARQVELSGSPSFFTPKLIVESDFPKSPTITPNPMPGGRALLSWWMFEDGLATVEIYDANGRLIATPVSSDALIAGPHQLELDWHSWPRGVYMIRVFTPGSEHTVQAVR